MKNTQPRRSSNAHNWLSFYARSHKRTSRRVPLSAFLITVLHEWLKAHPGGPFLFSQPSAVIRSKKKRESATAVTRDEAHDHLKRALAEGKWKVVLRP